MSNRKIEDLRKKIDEIDEKLVESTYERARFVLEVGDIKKTEKLEFSFSSREREILERLAARNKGPFPQDTLRAVYREILSSSLSLERPLTLRISGPAPRSPTWPECSSSPCRPIPAVESIRDVFVEVEHGRFDYGVCP